MKRDPDLIRKIVAKAECLESNPLSSFEVAGYSAGEVCEHVRIASRDLGLVEAKFLPNSTDCVVLRLTNEGHEFLQAIQDDTRWSRCKEKLLSASGFFTRETIKAIISNSFPGLI